MVRIVVFQSRRGAQNIEREQHAYRRAFGGDVEVVFYSALEGDVDWPEPKELFAKHDGVVLGGSGDCDFDGGDNNHVARTCAGDVLARLAPVVRAAFEKRFPLFGVCFGHQLIAQLHGGHVRNDRKQAKTGSYEVHLTEVGRKDALFDTLPHRFMAQYNHKDSVTTLPEGAVILTEGERCRFSALRYESGAYSTQFHPERLATEMTGSQYAGVPVEDAPESNQILRSWIGQIRSA